MKKTIRCLTSVLILMGCYITGMDPEASARIYYVAPDGNDAHSGTAQEPWQSFSMATRQAQAGDTVMIGGGTYTSMLEITRSGTPEASIVFQGEKEKPAVIDASGKRHGVIIWNASYIQVRGMIVRNSLRSGIHIHDHLDADDRGADFNVIEGNTVQECGREGYNGIYVGGHQNRIEGNRVLDNGRREGQAGGEDGHGIYILGDGNIVSSNQVSGNARVGIRMEGEKNRVEKNRISDNQDFGLTIWVDPPLKCNDTFILGNDFENNVRGGISIYGQGKGQKPERVYIAGNRLHHQRAEYGIRLLDVVRQVKINLNRISGHYENGFLVVEKRAGKGFTETNNLFCGEGAFTYLNRDYASFEAYRAASGQGKGSRYLTSEQPTDCQ